MKIISGPHFYNQLEFKNNFKKDDFVSIPACGNYQEGSEMFQKLAELEMIYFQALQNLNKKQERQINSLYPVEKPNDLSNTKEFAKYLEYKITKQLNHKTRADIEKLIDDIKTETNAKRELIEEVLLRLTQFASYSSLNAVSDEFNYHKIDLMNAIKCFNQKLDLCNLVLYLGIYKEQIKYDVKNDNIVLFLDDVVIKKIEKDKQDGFAVDEYKQVVKDNNIKLIAFDSMHISNNDKFMSYSMFGQTDSLKDIAVFVINKMIQENVTLDEALNGDFEKRARKLFGDDVEIVYLKNRANKKDKIDGILKQINPIMPNKAQIYAIIKKITDTYTGVGEDGIYSDDECEYENKTNTEKIAKYLDSALIAYSSESLNDVLVKKHNHLKEFLEKINKTIDDVVYLIPQAKKSFDLITYQYLKANNIDFDKVVYGDDDLDIKDKVIIILDDIAATGDSIVENSFNYMKFLMENYDKDFNIIFSPILATNEAIDNVTNQINELGRKKSDYFIYENSINCDYKRYTKTPNNELADYVVLLDGLGYNDNGLCVSFPYCAPDNNSGFGLLFSQFFLQNPYIKNKFNIWGQLDDELLYGKEPLRMIAEINELSKQYYE